MPRPEIPRQRPAGGRGGKGTYPSQRLSRDGRGGSPGARGAGSGSTPRKPPGSSGQPLMFPWLDIPLSMGALAYCAFKWLEG